jgi:hypothetical protein
VSVRADAARIRLLCAEASVSYQRSPHAAESGFVLDGIAAGIDPAIPELRIEQNGPVPSSGQPLPSYRVH